MVVQFNQRLPLRVDDACNNAQFEIPNIISPNGDGFNDFFEIRFEGVKDVSMLRIYNRWGELVYKTDILRITGTVPLTESTSPRGIRLLPGGTCLDNEQFTKTGNVTILK